jgi:hypothetical protein
MFVLEIVGNNESSCEGWKLCLRQNDRGNHEDIWLEFLERPRIFPRAGKSRSGFQGCVHPWIDGGPPHIQKPATQQFGGRHRPPFPAARD